MKDLHLAQLVENLEKIGDQIDDIREEVEDFNSFLRNKKRDNNVSKPSQRV